MKLNNSDLEGSQLGNVNLRVATLKGANLQNCILRGAVLAGADLEVRYTSNLCSKNFPLMSMYDLTQLPILTKFPSGLFL